MKVYAATISHRHGVNLYMGLTPESLDTQLADYAAQWWDEAKTIGDDVPSEPPAIDAEAIDLYFEIMMNFGGDEFLERFDPQEVN